MKGLYRYREDFGRGGRLEGVFIADSEIVERAKGRVAYFGEVLGKHSEVFGAINDTTITLLTMATDVLEIVTKYKLESGHCPIWSTRCSECHDEVDENLVCGMCDAKKVAL